MSETRISNERQADLALEAADDRLKQEYADIPRAQTLATVALTHAVLAVADAIDRAVADLRVSR